MKSFKNVLFGCRIGVSLVMMAGFLPAKEYAKHRLLDEDRVQQSAKFLQEAISAKDFERRRELCEKAISLLDEDHFAAKRLRAALRDENALNEIKRIHESLTFRPWVEAELPAGFPPFTPLHHIEVKMIPRYRLARVEMKQGMAGDSRAFWTLFNHIKRENIEMTAPVQTTYDASGNELAESSMAFLYGTTKLGELGIDEKDKRVQVEEFAPGQVLSIGMRGEMTEESIRNARKKLLSWLEEHKSEYLQSGSLRTMGYNSPFVSRSKKYYEVQIPVKLVHATQNKSK